MRSVGDAYDNVMCEGFFAALECELRIRGFVSQAEARMPVFSYTKGWYNLARRHSGRRPDGMSPFNHTAVPHPTHSF